MATAIETELLRLEKEYWRAMKDHDVDTMVRLTDDQCIVTGPQGVGRLDKATLAEMMKSPGWLLRDYRIDSDVQVRMLRDDVAVLAYKVHEEMTVDGKPVSLDANEASTWIRRDGAWVCASHSEALSGDPFGRDRSSQQRA